MPLRLAAATVGLSVLLLPITASAEDQFSNVGTLTCTTSATPEDPSIDVELSCHFNASSGHDTNYAGRATRKGEAGFPPGKRVVVWSVFARNAKIDQIAGIYRGETGGQPPQALVGGDNNGIQLHPVTGPQVGVEPAPTELSLTLVPTKA